MSQIIAHLRLLVIEAAALPFLVAYAVGLSLSEWWDRTHDEERTAAEVPHNG